MSAAMPICEHLSVLEMQSSRVWNSIRLVGGQAALRVWRLRGFIALCDQGTVSLTNFATGVVIGRVCGKGELGAYALAWTLITVATDISAALITTPYTVIGPMLHGGERRLYLGSIFAHQVLFSTSFALAMYATAVLGSWWAGFSPSVCSIIKTTASVIVFITLKEFVRRVSFAELKIGWALAVDVMTCVAQVVSILCLLHLGALTVSRTYVGLGLSSLGVTAGWLALRPEMIHLDLRMWLRDLKRNWVFGKWILGSALLWAFAMYLYPWMLAAFHGIAVAGTWAACSTIVALGNPVLLGLGNYVGPKISHVYASCGTVAMQRYVYRSSTVFTVLLLPLVLTLAICGERIITGIYGKAYTGSAGIVVLLALNMLVSALAFPYSRGLFTLECAKADTLINLVAVALLFTMGIATVKCYGALGAAAALLLSSSTTAVIRVEVFRRQVRRSALNYVSNYA